VSDETVSADYLRERVEQYRGWYDARARRCKQWYLRLRVLGLLAGSVVPVLISVDSTPAHLCAIAASLIILLTLALDGVLRLREQWENYRYTEQYLDRERYLYRAAAGPYQNLSAQAAFTRFVERVEWAIAAENSTTLATMALSPDTRINGGSNPH